MSESWNEECAREKRECLKLLEEYEKYDVTRRREDLDTGREFYQKLFPGEDVKSFDSYSTVAEEKREIEKSSSLFEKINDKINRNGRSLDYCKSWNRNYPNSRTPREKYFRAAMEQEKNKDQCISMLKEAELAEAPYMVDFRLLETYIQWLEKNRGPHVDRDKRDEYFEEAYTICNKLKGSPAKRAAAGNRKKLDSLQRKYEKDDQQLGRTPTAVPKSADKPNFFKRHRVLCGMAILCMAFFSFIYIYPAVSQLKKEEAAAKKQEAAGRWEVETTVNYNGKSYESVKAQYRVSEEGVLLAVEGLDGATSWAIPDEVDGIKITALDWSQFRPKGLDNVKVLQLPQGLTEIRRGCFTGQNLETVILPGELTTLGDRAFSDCVSLAEVIFPEDGQIRNAAANAFLNTIWYARNMQQKGYVLGGGVLFAVEPSESEFMAPEGTVVISDELCIRNNYSRVVIPDGVKTIGSHAFAYSETLESVSLPDGLLSVGEGAFRNCAKLAELEFRGSVEKLGRCAFEQDRMLTSLQLPEGLTTVPERAFYVCGLKEVSFPTTLRTIEKDAFYYSLLGGGALSNVILPEGLTTIGDGAFIGHFDAEFSFPSSLLYVGVDAFSRLPGSREEDGMLIKDGVLFQYKGDAVKVSIPQDVRVIAGGAFRGNNKLAAVDMPEGVKTLGGSAFEGCRVLSRVSLPGTLEWVGDSAFKNCSSLTFIEIPDSVTRIGARAFEYSALSIYEGGAGVTTIGENAFNGAKLPETALEALSPLMESTE